MSGAPSNGDAPRTLGGRYRLESLIARGGMAAVWRARDDVLARTVAIKVLHDHLAADDEFVERFRREAIAAAKLTHPHVVSLYDTGREGREVWLVMELIEGSTLRDLMDGGALDVARAADIGEKTARGLGFAHEHGLVHRDVKPANILLGDDGTVKVTDFGIAKSAGTGADLTGTGTVLGTAAYVAPEQIRSEPLDGACDQYALGCVLYEALTGRRPFDGDTPIATAAKRLTADPPPVCSVRPDVPAALGAVIDRALARSPADRFPTAGDMADALLPFAGRAETIPPARPARAARARQAPAPLVRPPPRTGSPPPRTGPPPGPTGSPPGPPPGAGPAPHRTAQHRTAQHRTAQHRTAAPPPAGRSRSRPGSRRWLPATLVVTVVAAAVLLVAAATTGIIDSGGDSPDSPDSQAQGNGLVSPVAVTLFDPGGTGSESGADLPALLDGDPSTGWQTVGYNTPDFGGLKAGLGFWLDLGTPQAVDSVALRTDTPGVSYEIRTADAPARAIAGWAPAGAQAQADELSEVVFADPVVTRYLLVWITGDLQPDGSGRFRAQLSELAVRGGPA